MDNARRATDEEVQQIAQRIKAMDETDRQRVCDAMESLDICLKCWGDLGAPGVPCRCDYDSPLDYD